MSWYWIVLCVVGALAVLIAVIAYLVFRFAMIDTAAAPPDEASLSHSAYHQYLPLIREGTAWIKAQPQETVDIQSYDGLKLVGHLLPHEQSRGVLVLFHGFRSCYLTDFSCGARFYHSLGLSLLLVEQRGQQASEGRYMTYGIKERRDVAAWIDYVNQCFGSNTPVFLGGISMGSATVQMACGLSLPCNVLGVLADCGFTSAYDEFKYILNKRLHLPDFPLLPLMGLYCRLFAGIGLRECSTVTVQQQNTIPTLFFHGKKDLFVPCYMTEKSYAACKSSDKELFLAQEATHALSYLTDTVRYEQLVRDFIDRQILKRKG